MAFIRCPRCGEYNNSDAERCDRCRVILADAFAEAKGRTPEQIAAEGEAQRRAARAEAKAPLILVTTTSVIQNRAIGEYLGIVSTAVVLGTGAFSEIAASFADAFGTRSGAFQNKIQRGA